MNVIFFGAGPYVIPIIELLQQRCNLTLVVTTEKGQTEPVAAYCRQHAISLLCVKTLKDLSISQKLSALHAPVAVLAYFGLIVPQSIIDIFPKGIVNIHPSLLPKYRGPTPGQTALLNGDHASGVSVMLLDREIDHGPVLAQEPMALTPNETAESLYKKAFRQGAKLLERVLDDYLAGKLQQTEQDHASATLTRSFEKQDGFVDITKRVDRDKLQRMIRAYSPWPGVWTETEVNKRKTRIKFLPGNDVSPFLLQVEGKKPMTVKDFLNGYRAVTPWLEQLMQ